MWAAGKGDTESGAPGGDGGGRGDGTVAVGAGNGPASRTAGAGSCDGAGGVVKASDLRVTALVGQMARHEERQETARLLGREHRSTAIGSAGESTNVAIGSWWAIPLGTTMAAPPWPMCSARRRWRTVPAGRFNSGLILAEFRRHVCNQFGRRHPEALAWGLPGPDTECVVWLFQCFHCLETWGRDPCSPGPAP